MAEKKEESLDKILQNIVDSYSEEANLKDKEIKLREEDDPSKLESLSKIILNKVDSNDEVAKQIYDLFYGDLAVGRDRSDSSKEALLKSLELKVESSKVLTELAKSLAKKEQLNSGNVGVFFNNQPGKKFDIDIKKIQNELDDDSSSDDGD